MKTSTLLPPLLLCASPVFAILPVGRGEIEVGLTTSAAYDSNLFGSPDPRSDVYVTVTPLLAYARREALIQATADVSLSVIRYFDQTSLNAENIDSNVGLQLAEGAAGKFSGTATAGYHESSEVNTDLNRRVRSRAFTVAGRGMVATGVRTDVAFGADYGKTLRSLASDQEQLNAQLAFDYKQFLENYTLRLVTDYNETQSSGDNILGARLNQHSYQGQAVLSRAVHEVFHVNAGYGYRVLHRSADETTSGETTLSGPLVTAGVDGPLLPPRYFPKIKSSFSIEYSEARAPGVNDPGSKSVAGNLSLNWEARTTTNVGFTATRGQRLSADDLTVQSTAVQFTVDQKLRYNLTGKFAAGYDWEDFRGIARSDRIATADASLSYAFARYWHASLVYRLTSTESTRAESVFDRHVVTASVSCRL